MRGKPGEGIKVAVFDTWPANLSSRAAAYPGNQILARAASGQLVSWVRRYAVAASTSVVLCPHVADKAKLEVSSHGLFVADIIKDIAPNADVRVYRVLGDDGVGDLQTLAQAVIDALADAAGKPLVLNLSLGFGPQLALLNQLLTDDQLQKGDLNAWEQAIANAVPPANPAAQLASLLTDGLVKASGGKYNFLRALAIIDHNFTSITANANALAIAAAGNDSRTGQPPFGPRMPAAVEGVVGVSSYVPPARGAAFARAAYSNNDELFPNNDGVGAYGGFVSNASNVTTTSNGLIGLYTSEKIPAYMPGHAPHPPSTIPSVDNTTGWAMWSGSSFATPIAAGFAACLWSEDTTKTSTQVFNLVTHYPGGANRPSLPFQQS